MSPEAGSAEARAVERLLDWQIPSVRHRYSRRDTAFYALSVGVGHDPMDPAQRALVDPWNPRLAALPSMALVLGYPGFWLGEPAVHAATGVEAANVLHVEQAIDFTCALPSEAEVIGDTRVTALVDRGAGRGCHLHSERSIRDAGNGALLATCRQVHLLRGQALAGSRGASSHARRAMPQDGPAFVIDATTRPEQAMLYRLNGDANPLHFDPLVACRAGFERPILHGMATFGIVCHALLRALVDGDPARLRSLSLRMSAPVLPGDTLRTEIWRDGSFRARAVERSLVVIDDGYAVTA